MRKPSLPASAPPKPLFVAPGERPSKLRRKKNQH